MIVYKLENVNLSKVFNLRNVIFFNFILKLIFVDFLDSVFGEIIDFNILYKKGFFV